MTSGEDRERDGSEYLKRLAAAAEADLFVETEACMKDHHFDALRSLPGVWLDMAQRLNRAARLIAEQLERDGWMREAVSDAEQGDAAPPSLVEPYLLLVAFSLENLLKARIAQKPNPAAGGGRLPSDFCTHDLCKLASRAGLSIDHHADMLLKLASAYGLHWGRYPTPKKAADFPTLRVVNVARVIEVYDRFFAEVFASFGAAAGAP